MDDEEVALARRRVRLWPLPERYFLVSLTRPEVELIALAVAELDLRPVEEDVDLTHALTIDLRAG